MANTMRDIGSTIYTTSASVGVVSSYLSLIAGIIFGICSFVIGYYFWSYDTPYDGTTMAEVLDVQCSTVQNVSKEGEGSHIECAIKLKYNIDGQEHTTTLNSGTRYSKGDQVKIYYDPSDPSNITMSILPYETIGKIMSGIGCVVILGASLNAYFTTNYKSYAAVVGARQINDVFF
jgi:hypothetical protein